jgi:hypothetical protein
MIMGLSFVSCEHEWFYEIKKFSTRFTFTYGLKAFNPAQDDLEIYKKNTLAFLREWERFDVNNDLLGKLHYWPEPQAMRPLRLFDHNFLVDPSKPEQLELNAFPMVADVISNIIVKGNGCF